MVLLFASAVMIITAFTSSGVYTPSAGMKSLSVEMIGAGGNGGYSNPTSTGTVSIGSGGGSAGYVRSFFTNYTINSPQTIIVGTNTGDGITQFGSFLVAYPGQTGLTRDGSTVSIMGGMGGGYACSVDCIGIRGQQGGPGVGTWANYAFSGYGGSSVLGTGGSQISVTTDKYVYGIDATGYGAGGSGGCSMNDASKTSGGAGSPGIVIVTEYL